jgi:hypothetical protein
MRLLKARPQRGQVMVLLAMLVPLVLLPVAAYAAEAAYAATRAAALEWACSRAAEDAVQAIDANALRSGSALQIDPVQATQIAGSDVIALDPKAVVDTVEVGPQQVSVAAHEDVPATLAFWLPGGRLRVRGSASARLTPGYASPSSALPFATSSFSATASGSSSASSSSRQREGWMNG